MVKKLLWFLLYSAVFFFSLSLFFPKSSLYYLAERELKPFGVLISNEELQEGVLSLQLQDATLYVKGVQSATVTQTQILLLGLYNRITVHDVKLSKFLGSVLPSKIEDGEIVYSVLSPLEVDFHAQGDFGVVSGRVALRERKVELVVQPSKMMKNRYKQTLLKMKPGQNGEYRYVENF